MKFLNLLFASTLLLLLGLNTTTQAQLCQISISGQQAIGNGQQLAYSTQYFSGATYQWSTTGSLSIVSSSGSSVTVQGTAAGSGTLYVTRTLNGQVCNAAMSITVISSNTNPLDCSSLSISGSEGIGNNQTQTRWIKTNDNSGNSYHWTASSNITIIGSNSSQSVTIRGNTNGQGYLTCAVSKNGKTCYETKSITVIGQMGDFE